MSTADQPATIGALWRQLRDRLAANGIDTASLDARLLAQHAFGTDGVGLALREKEPVDDATRARFEVLAQRRLDREPVARILGERAFYGLDFALSADTLVPRPETELVVDLALDALAGRQNPKIIDLGTGTGCIAIAVLANHAGASGVAVDLSPGALETARGNAGRHGVADRLTLLQSDWFAAVDTDLKFDLVLSNPPYIVHDAISGLDADVRDHDPHLALDGGADGLNPYRILAHEAGRYLVPGGKLILEHGSGQSPYIHGLFERHGFVDLQMHADLDGHDRVFVATWPA